MEQKLKVEYVPLKSIKPYKNNAKEHPQEQIEQIKASIKEFGNIDPIGVWHDEIVEGHGRYEAAKQLKLKTVPIIRLDDLTDEQRRAYALVHNQLAMNTGWDEALFDMELSSISIDMSKFGIEAVAEEMQEQAEKYTKKVDVPQYEPTGEDVALWECYDNNKALQLIDEINDMGGAIRPTERVFAVGGIPARCVQLSQDCRVLCKSRQRNAGTYGKISVGYY